MGIVFNVPFDGTVSRDGTELQGTRSQMLKLIKDAGAVLKRAPEMCNMKPPVVHRGTLSYGAMEDFFCQAYPDDKTLLGVHVTRLFKHLLKVAESATEPKARCSVCDKTPREKFCKDNKTHKDNYKRFLIEVSWIKAYDQAVFDRKVHPRGLGDGLKIDLRALAKKL